MSGARIDVGPGFDGFGVGTCPEKYLTFGKPEKSNQPDLSVRKVLDYGKAFDKSDPLRAQAAALLSMLKQGSDAHLLVGHSYFAMVLPAAILINPKIVTEYFKNKSFLLLEPYSTLDSLENALKIASAQEEDNRLTTALAIKEELNAALSADPESKLSKEINTFNYLPFVTKSDSNISYMVATMNPEYVRSLYESVGLVYGKNFKIQFADKAPDKTALHFFQKVFPKVNFEIIPDMNHGLGTHPSLNDKRPENQESAERYDLGIRKVSQVAELIAKYAQSQLNAREWFTPGFLLGRNGIFDEPDVRPVEKERKRPRLGY